MAEEYSNYEYMSRYPHAYKSGMRARLNGASSESCTLISPKRREAWMRGYADTVSIDILDKRMSWPLFAMYPAAYEKGSTARFNGLPYVCPLKTPALINAWKAGYCDEDCIQNDGEE